MNEHMEVPLHGPKAAGRVTLIDAADYDRVNPTWGTSISQCRWAVQENTRKGKVYGPYVTTNLWRNGKSYTVYVHDFIMGCTGVDHRSRDTLDNRRANLRGATSEQNSWNQGPKQGTSKYKGVHGQQGKWQAKIRIGGGKRHYLGMYADEEDAALIVDAAAVKYHGDFAWLTSEHFPELMGRALPDLPAPCITSSRYRGVDWHNGSWRARIVIDGGSRFLGYYVEEIDAARAYNAEAIRVHGRRARLNVIDEELMAA